MEDIQLRILGEKIGHKFCVKLWKDTQMTEAQNFDIFYQKFQSAIDSIEKDMEEGDQLLLNISSGTPGMKSALMVMSTLESYRFQPIQVNSPKKRSNLDSGRITKTMMNLSITDAGKYSLPICCEN